MLWLDNSYANMLCEVIVCLIDAFSYAQEALSTNKEIVLPRLSDQLCVVADGSVKQSGIGATLYVVPIK